MLRRRRGATPSAAAPDDPGAQRVSVALGEPWDGQPVGDGVSRAADLLSGPLPAGRLQDIRAVRIGDQEAVVVSKPRALGAAGAALTVPFEQLGDHPDRFVCAAGPLQRQPDQVHP